MCPDWNQLFKKSDKILKAPDPLAGQFIEAIGRNARVFDLGCGAGRHLVQMAKAGLQVTGADISPVGLGLCRDWLSETGLNADLILSDMAAPPFVSGSFDGVISINVLNHGMVSETAYAINEVHRILKKGGLFCFLIIGREDARYGEGVEIEPHTFIPKMGIEAGVPHHYYTPDELTALLNEFSEVNLRERKRPYDDNEPVFGDDPRLKTRTDATLQHWAVKAWK